MKTYDEAVGRAAAGKYHDDMGGSLIPRANAGEVDMIAFLFEVDVDNVYEAVHNAYKDMIERRNN